jgi:hypothetical protein
MKKLSCVLAVVAATVYLISCKSDTLGGGGGGCSMEGNWKVKSVDIQSEKLNPSILEISKNIALARTYNFTADSITINEGTRAAASTGKYVVEDGRLKMTGSGVNGTLAEDMKIDDCGGSEVKLSYRMPADTTIQAIATTTLVIVKQ